jgi:hypothetical protein
VLVQSPNVCDRDVVKEPVPADFLPVVFWAPDAGNLEFLIAYLHERAYEQPISKLTFHRATVTEATEADYKAWRETRWKDNIVPTGDRREYDGRGYFRGEGFFPKGDPRNKMLLRMACHSFIRAPISGTLQDAVRARWPTDHPRYWLLDSSYLRPVLNKDWLEINDYARRHGQWDREALGALASFYEGKGVNRSSGVGHIERNPTPAIASGLAPRIPYRTDTGYPWASDRLLTQGVLDTQIDTAGGADQGFAYCYRDMFSCYFPRPQGGEIAAADHRIFVDGQLVGSWPQARSLPPAPAIVERDEYLWFTSYFDLTHELARME